MSSYFKVYKPLAGSSEIRLLTLQPGAKGEPINCTLDHERLSEYPIYEALSYMWGSKDMESIFLGVENTLYPVRHNLWQALTHLRLPNKPRVLWIDAICINQSNTKERNNQVAQMSLVYNQASQVVVWLGLADQTTTSAIQALKSEDRPTFGTDPILPILQYVKELCYKPYWSRLWIIQELYHAGRIQIYCGDLHIEWKVFLEFRADLESFYLDSYNCNGEGELSEYIYRSMPSRLCSARPNCDQSRRNVKEGLYSLFDLCSQYGNSNCEDPRDKVFGLHSMAIPCCRAANPIDYSLSLSQIIKALLFHYMNKHVPRDRIQAGQREGMSTVKNLQNFHETLGIDENYSFSVPAAFGSNAYLDPQRQCLTSSEVWVSGTIQSRISHLWALDNQSDISWACFPRLSELLVESIQNMENKVVMRTTGSINTPSEITFNVNTSLDLVTSFPDPSGDWLSFDSNGNKLIASFIAKTREDNFYSCSDDIMTDYVRRLINYARDAARKYSTNGCSLALDAAGNAYFVPKESDLGNTLFTFERCGVTAIGRMTPHDTSPAYHIFGRCVNFMDNAMTVSGSGPNVDMKFDLSTLQLLTRVSAIRDVIT